MNKKLFLFLSLLAFFNVFAQTTHSLTVTFKDRSGNAVIPNQRFSFKLLKADGTFATFPTGVNSVINGASGTNPVTAAYSGGNINAAVATSTTPGQITFTGLPDGKYQYTLSATNTPCYPSPTVAPTVTISGADIVDTVLEDNIKDILVSTVTKKVNVLTPTQTSPTGPTFTWAWSVETDPIAHTYGPASGTNNQRIYTATTPGNYKVTVGVTTTGCVASSTSENPVTVTSSDQPRKITFNIKDASSNSITNQQTKINIYSGTTNVYGGSNQIIKDASTTTAGQYINLNNFADGHYNYTIDYLCFREFGSFDVLGADVVVPDVIMNDTRTTNQLNLSVVDANNGVAGPLPGFAVTLTNSLGVALPVVTTQSLNAISVYDVPNGVYTYKASKACYNDAVGTVTLGCGNNGANMGANDLTISVAAFNKTVAQQFNVLTATATGTQYTYKWYDCTAPTVVVGTSQSYTATAVGTYKVAITNTTCNTTLTSDCIPVAASDLSKNLVITINDGANPLKGATVVLTDSNNTVVSGTTVTTDLNGQIIYKNLTAGNYTYTVAYEPCYTPLSARSITIAADDNLFDTPLALTVIPVVNTVKKYANLLIPDAKGGQYSYQWYNNNVAIENANNQNYKATAIGSYSVSITGCNQTVTSNPITVESVDLSGNFIINFYDSTSANPVANQKFRLYHTDGSIVSGFGFREADVNGIAVLTGLELNTYKVELVNTNTPCYVPVSVNNANVQTITVNNVNVNGEGYISVDPVVLVNTVVQNNNVLTPNQGVLTGVTFNWTVDNGSGTFVDVPSNGTSRIYTAEVPGIYKVTITGCTQTVTSAPITVTADNLPHNVTITINDGVNPLQGAQVTMYSGAVTKGSKVTNANGDAVFSLYNGDYTYNVTYKCLADFKNQSLTVNGADVTDTKSMTSPKNVNNVSVSISNGDSFGTLLGGFAVNVKGANGYNQTITSDIQAVFLNDVPYGDYTYTVLKDCYAIKTGTLTVQCNNGAENQIYVVASEETPADINVTVSQEANVLTANAIGNYNYQWINCGNENTPIEGANSKTYTATVAGTYSVKITNACSVNATSTCYEVTEANLGLEQNAISVFTVYPNPVIDNVVLQMNNDFQNVSVEVVNMQGQVVGKSVYNGGTNHKMDLSGLASGLYILNVTADQMHATKRIIKK